MGDPVLERHPEALERRAAVGEHRRLREPGEALGELERAVEVGARGDELVDEPPAVRLAGVDDPAGEDHLERPAHADDPRQPLGAAVDQRHAEPALGEPEPGVGRRDPQVAPERELEPAGQAPAGDRGDRRLRGRQPAEPERAVGTLVEPGGDLRLGVVAGERGALLGDRLQVGAGAERLRPLAGEDEDAGLVVGLEAVEALAQQVGRLVVDGVAALRPRDRQDARRRPRARS